MRFVTNEDLIKNGIILDAFIYRDLSDDLINIYSSYENKFTQKTL